MRRAAPQPPRRRAPQRSSSRDEDEKARGIVRGIVSRSERAFGYLYGALPDDLRPQVAHLSQGFAYALWVWIEEKFQSKESDNVNALLSEWSTVEQSESESFDAYRARVNKLAGLLGDAAEPPSERMFSHTLLEKLRPSYRSVVLALQNGPLLKATKEIDVPLVAAHKKTVLAVDWTEVTRMVNAHERSEMRLGGGGGEGQPGGDSQALSVRQYGGRSSSSSGGVGGGWQQQQGKHADKKKKTEGNQKKLPAYNEKGEPRCFNCDVYGHMGRDCSQKKTKAAPRSSAQRRAGQDREEAAAFSNP